jgi:hypothetical protein
MISAIGKARTVNGPHLGRATVAIAIAAACIGLLVFLLTPNPGSATAGPTETGLHGGHWDGSAGHGAVKLIPI